MIPVQLFRTFLKMYAYSLGNTTFPVNFPSLKKAFKYFFHDYLLQLGENRPPQTPVFT